MQDLLSPARYMQIVDSDSGEAVCYLGWEFLVKAGGEERERKDDGGEKYAADANKEAIEVLLGGGKRMREKLMAGKNYARMYLSFSGRKMTSLSFHFVGNFPGRPIHVFPL